MIIGNGDVASILKDRDGFIFFASGVSNSTEDRESEYDREIDLLLSQDRELHLVYFSSLAVFYGLNRYAAHKWQMEHLVKQYFPSYTIVRLGNITWGTNPHTFLNYFKDHPKAPIKDEWRYLVTKQEFLHWMKLIPDWNCELTITGKRMKVREALNEYVMDV